MWVKHSLPAYITMGKGKIFYSYTEFIIMILLGTYNLNAFEQKIDSGNKICSITTNILDCTTNKIKI